MELKDFIKGTVTAIAESVLELNNELSNLGVIANPNSARFTGDLSKMIYNPDGEDKSIIHEIEFNLSITEGSSTDTEGGIKIAVINGGINNKEKIENLNTVKFSIPIVLPSPKT